MQRLDLGCEWVMRNPGIASSAQNKTNKSQKPTEALTPPYPSLSYFLGLGWGRRALGRI
jgi:hypothetical protein